MIWTVTKIDRSTLVEFVEFKKQDGDGKPFYCSRKRYPNASVGDKYVMEGYVLVPFSPTLIEVEL